MENYVDKLEPYVFGCGKTCGKIDMVFHTFNILKWKISYQHVINRLSTKCMWITNEPFP